MSQKYLTRIAELTSVMMAWLRWIIMQQKECFVQSVSGRKIMCSPAASVGRYCTG